MGISTTAHAESLHSAFKHAIETVSELETVFEKIDQQIHISIYAIDKIKRTLATIEVNSLIYKDTETCKCSIRINYKLPCHHMISKKGVISLDIINKCWHLHHFNIKYLPHSALESSTTEEIFYQLLNDTSMRAKLIAHIDQVITMPLSEPVKAPNIFVSKDRLLKTKHEKLMNH
ncbi:7086_t:CDS:2 [Cetraspora pellucida]|uniref:7086_t:CDS:1 n=1 Tax=Cetraspora pellucida TaxID=1433469 RepID=A0A9N9DV70_9GLOM|nr:7086_t:CDS:2 [Cetraspora pellucida]